MHLVTDPPPSRASRIVAPPLPHFDLGASGRGCAALQAVHGQCGSWLVGPPNRCDGINWVCLMYRGACIAGKPAPTEKQCTTVLVAELDQHCGSGLARERGGSVTNELTGTPHSRASPLPHLDLISSGKSAVAVLLLCFCFNHSGRLPGRRALLLICC
ncbi:hypothetical protein D0N73_30050 [Pseudomonas fluorescens]|nr:hypothetical protein D0N73_30050 [Pseudomonas fluorescens]